MKRFIYLLCIIMFTLTGCSPPWDKDKVPDFESTGAAISGTIISIQPINVELEVVGEDGTVISELVEYTSIDVVNFDDKQYTVYIGPDLGTEDLHPDTRVNLVAWTVENEDYRMADSFEITYQPTQYIVGITAEELISRPPNHDKQMSHIDYIMVGDLDYKSDGMFEHIQSKSQTVRSDTYTRRHVSTERNIVKDKDINESSIYEYYLTKNETLRRYFNDNYTGWYYEDTSEDYIMQPNFTFQDNDFTVDEYTIDDNDRLVVKGTWNINTDNFVGAEINNIANTYGLSTNDVECHVTVIYDRVTFDLYNIQLDITTSADCLYDETPVNLKEFSVNVYGIEYDTDAVTVPESIRASAIDSYYIDNPIEEVPVLIVTNLLCQELLGVEQSTLDMIKEYMQIKDNEDTKFKWGIDADVLCDDIKRWINNYNVNQFMEEYAGFTGNEDYVQATSASIIYSWLLKYNIKIDDYKEVPTE